MATSTKDTLDMIAPLRTVFHDLPINKKLLAAYLSIFFVTLLLGSAVLYSLVRRTIESSIEQELNNTTNTILSMVQTTAKVSIKNNLRAVAEQSLKIIEHIFQKQLQGDFTPTQAKSQAREMLMAQSIGKTGYIYCVDSQGIATVHPNPEVEGGVFLQHEFVREQIQRREGYLEYEWKNPGEPFERPKALFMTYFAPWDWIISVSTYQDEFTELINISDFRDSILSLQFGETGYSYVIDSAGRLVIHPVIEGNNAFDFADASGQAFVRTICNLKRGKMVYAWKNPGERVARDKLVIFNYIPEYDWIVASSCYLEESYAPLKKIRNVVLVTGATTLLLTIPITWLMSIYIVRPMKKLMKNFRQGAGGDLTVRMDVNSVDEMGQLAGYFNYFMEKLQHSNKILTDEVRERKQAEKELRISEEKYRTILERMEEGYYEVDMAGCFTFFNASFQSILGYPEAVLSEMNMSDILAPGTHHRIRNTFLEVMHSGKSVKTVNCRLICGNGSICSVETSISPMKDFSGRMFGYRGVLKDITAKVQADLALRQSEEMFSKAFRSSPSGMFIVTADEGLFIDVNNSFLQFTGFTASEVIGKTLSEMRFFIPDEKNVSIPDRLVQDCAICQMEINFRAVGDACRMGILSAEMLVLKTSRCILASLEDVTESRRLEREILDISERERQRIGRTLHDDLCPHLLGVEVLSNILRQKLSQKANPEAAAAAKIQSLIQDCIQKMRRLSRGLYPVDFSGRVFDTAIADLVTRTQEIYGVSCRFKCDLPISLADDTIARHAYYIAHEALHNATKHAKARNIFVALNLNNENAVLSIQDDGTGILTAEASRGLGMRIMRYRARRIGAELLVESDTVKGTTITLEIRLPSLCGTACG